MAYAAWTASTAYALGDVVRATTQQGTGFVFRCIVAGTSASSEPTWPQELYRTNDGDELLGYVVDGTVTWAAVSAVSEQLAKLAPSAVIELFQLALVSGVHYDPNDPPATTTYYFHAGTNELNGNIVWAGTTYTRYPVQAEGFEYAGSGQLPTPRLTVANLDGLLTLALLDVNAYTPGNDLINAKVTRVRTLKRYLDAVNFTGGTNATADPYAEFPRDIFYISRKTSETRNSISWDLASVFDMQGVRGPKRQAIALCQWVYKSAECSYVTQPGTLSATYSASGTAITITVDYSTWTTLAVGQTINVIFSGATTFSGAYLVETLGATTISVTSVTAISPTTGSCTLTTFVDVNDAATLTASADKCSKKLSGCEARFGANNPKPFGGFPGVGQFS